LQFSLSSHAKERLQQRQIKEEWISRALDDPDFEDIDPNNNTLHRVWKRIPEYSNLAMRVVYNPSTKPVKIITVLFDRGYNR